MTLAELLGTGLPIIQAPMAGVQGGALGIAAALTNLFTGGPARGIVNRIMRELGPIAPAPAFPPAMSAITPLRARAEAAGRGDCSPPWCGQNACGCREASAASVVAALAEGL